MLKHPLFIIKTASNGMFFFHLTASNGEVVASSELFTTKEGCMNGIDTVIKSAAIAQVQEDRSNRKMFSLKKNNQKSKPQKALYHPTPQEAEEAAKSRKKAMEVATTPEEKRHQDMMVEIVR